MKTKLEPLDIENVIAKEEYIILNGTTTTLCHLTLKNGYTVIGKSACVDPAKFDADVGARLARADAVRQIWPLEGYLLQQRVWEAQQPAQTPERKPVRSEWQRDVKGYGIWFAVGWDDGTTEEVTREKAVEMRRKWPWLWAGMPAEDKL